MLTPFDNTILDVDWQNNLAVDLRSMTGTDVSGFSGYTVVVKIRRVENLVGGSKVRLRIAAPVGSSGSLSAIYFGRSAGASGRAWDFASSPTQVKFNNGTSLTLSANGIYTSDPFTFTFDTTRAHSVAMNVSSSALRKLTTPVGGHSVASFYKAATSEASSTTKSSGYTAQGRTSYGIFLIKAI